MIDRDVLLLIRERMPKMSKGHRKIANYVLYNYEDAAFETAGNLGRKVGVSESTVIRFATTLGYEGYPEYQKALGEAMRDKIITMKSLDEDSDQDERSEIIKKVIAADIQNLRDTADNFNAAAFEMSVEMLLEAENVYICGLRNNEPLASFLKFYLSMVRGNVFLIGTNSATEMLEQMVRINSKDCFVGISFPRYSLRTLKAMELANDRNAKVIAITDDEHSPMTLYSSCNLLAKSQMSSIASSLVAPLSIINALIVAISLKCQDELNKNLEELDNIWENYQINGRDEMDYINFDNNGFDQ